MFTLSCAKKNVLIWLYLTLMLLAGLTRTSYAINIIDSSGKIVGEVNGFDGVILKINNKWFNVTANQAGFVSNKEINFYHKGPNCSGPRYSPYYNDRNNFYKNALVWNSTLIVHDVGPYTNQRFCGVCEWDPKMCPAGNDSVETLHAGEDLTQNGTCQAFDSCSYTNGKFGSLSTIPLPNFLPPFHLK